MFDVRTGFMFGVCADFCVWDVRAGLLGVHVSFVLGTCVRDLYLVCVRVLCLVCVRVLWLCV